MSRHSVIYCRVNVKRQGETGCGHTLDSQESICSRVAEGKNLKIRGIFYDLGISALMTPNKRRGFQEVLDTIQRGDCLIVYRLNRLCKNSSDFISILNDLTKKKASLYCVVENITLLASDRESENFWNLLESVKQTEKITV